MISRPPLLEKLIEQLRTLPTVGPKMSERIALHLLKLPDPNLKEILDTIRESCAKVRPCETCGFLDECSPCRICSDSSRDQTVLCIVEDSKDLIAVSRVRRFNGLFHVLGGVLSPLNGVGPQDLRIHSLSERLKEGKINEMILALNPDMEGETTSDYLSKQVHSLGLNIKTTRLAQGLPAGGELEYTDELTLTCAFEGRKELV